METYFLISSILYENEDQISPTNPEEQARRKRMMRRMAGLGIAAGVGLTGAELMLHKGARADIVKAAKQSGIGNKIKGIAKQVWKPMAVGAGADLVVEPTNTAIAQHLEDRYQKKKQNENPV